METEVREDNRPRRNWRRKSHNITNPNGRCYRGAGPNTWLDFTCEHPNTDGHNALRGMVMSVIDE